jgi:intraflagellar transport protein 172
MLVNDGQMKEAIQATIKYNVPYHSTLIKPYMKLCKMVFMCNDASTVTQLFNMLLALVFFKKLTKKSNNKTEGINESLNQYLVIAHHMKLRDYCAKKTELASFAAKNAISLLRYTKNIPADLAFMEAGQLCKVIYKMTLECWDE